MNNDKSPLDKSPAAAMSVSGKKSVSGKVKRDEWCFCFGVFNLLFTTWVISVLPHCYWIYHTAKMTYLLLHRFKKFTKIQFQFFLLDFCYCVNFWSFAVIFVAILTSLVPAFQSYHSYIEAMGPLVFRVFFTWCVGPLAVSIATFRNSLVFHSSDQIIILAVHLSPNLAVYGMKWWAGDLMMTFGNIFPINCNTNIRMDTWYDPTNLLSHSDDCPGSFRDLVIVPILSYISLWSIPYFLFFFLFGVEFISRGAYHTMYSTMKDKEPLKYILSFGGKNEGIIKPIIYMSFHGVLCALTFLVLGPLLWHSFILHTLYLLVLLGMAIKNSASYYFEVFAERYSKTIDGVPTAATS